MRTNVNFVWGETMKKQAINVLKRLMKQVIFRANANRLLAQVFNLPIILGFHRIKNNSRSLLNQRVGIIDPVFFESIICYLRSLGYRFVTLDSLVDRLTDNTLGRVAAVTFDDGFNDLYFNAYPILKKTGIPFSLFLTTSTVEAKSLLWLHKLYISIEQLGHLDRDKLIQRIAGSEANSISLNEVLKKIVHSGDIGWQEEIAASVAHQANMSKGEENTLARELYLTRAQLREMAKNGLFIEVHGHKHRCLSKLDQVQTEREIGTSVGFIEYELGGNPQFFSLPFGRNNRFVDNIVRHLGIIGICADDARAVGFSPDPFRLSRIGAETNQDIFEFSFCLTHMYLNRFIKHR